MLSLRNRKKLNFHGYKTISRKIGFHIGRGEASFSILFFFENRLEIEPPPYEDLFFESSFRNRTFFFGKSSLDFKKLTDLWSLL